jgi:GT2 family glycosyltransferase
LTALVISFLKVNGEFNTFVAFTKMAGLYKIFPNQNYSDNITNTRSKGEVAILVGAFMFMERALYVELNGFDENCFMYSDDIDLS